MTAREIVRTGLVLGAIWIAVSAVASLSSAVASLVSTAAVYNDSPTEWLESLWWIVPLIVGVACLFGLFPAWFLFTRREAFSSRLVDETSCPQELLPSLFYGVALMVLGISISVNGIASVLSGTMIVLSSVWPFDDPSRPFLVSNLPIAGLVYLVAGVVVYRAGSRAILRAA